MIGLLCGICHSLAVLQYFFQCLGQGSQASLTLQSELGVFCRRYFPGYELYGRSYAPNGIETITPDYVLINVISVYHAESSICSNVLFPG